MKQVVVVGCGVVGAAIAYELSQVPDLAITVLDSHSPAHASTGAALGVLMGAISQRPKGNNLRMRLMGIQSYERWIPELERLTGQVIPFNRQGILRLCFEDEDLSAWDRLIKLRQQQGWQLELYDRTRLAQTYPQLGLERVSGAVYSPQDRQVDPAALTLALVAAARQRGVQFHFGSQALGIVPCPQGATSQAGNCSLRTSTAEYRCDWLVIAAGLGSRELTTTLGQPLEVRPVLGQALHIHLKSTAELPLKPVVTGNDVHIVPLGENNYWVGATVEFPVGLEIPAPTPEALDLVWQQAVKLWPAIEQGTVVRSWSGLRPRPFGRSAPIIEFLPGHPHVLLATGHYRNGVLLAPATAAKVREMITPTSPSSQ